MTPHFLSRPWSLALSLAAVCLAAAQPAFSADPETEQLVYRQAHQAMQRKDWASARALLLPLWTDSPTYDVASSLAQVEYQLGSYAPAATHLAFALEHVAPIEKPQTVERMQQGLSELRLKVGGIKVFVDQPGANVLVDGQPVASPLPSELFVEPGEHFIEARGAGVASAHQRLDVSAGVSYWVQLELARPAPVVSAPAAVPVVPAVHAPPTLPATPDVMVSRPLWPLALGGTLTAVGLGMAVGFTVSSNQAHTEWRTIHDRVGSSGCVDGTASDTACDALRDARHRERDTQALAAVGIGLTAVSAIATASYALFWPKRRRAAQTLPLSPTLAVARGNAELVLSGAF